MEKIPIISISRNKSMIQTNYTSSKMLYKRIKDHNY